MKSSVGEVFVDGSVNIGDHWQHRVDGDVWEVIGPLQVMGYPCKCIATGRLGYAWFIELNHWVKVKSKSDHFNNLYNKLNEKG